MLQTFPCVYNIDDFVTKFIGVGQNRCNQKHENEIVSNN